MHGDRQRARGDFRKLSKREITTVFNPSYSPLRWKAAATWCQQPPQHFLFHAARELSWLSCYKHLLKKAIKSTGQDIKSDQRCKGI